MKFTVFLIGLEQKPENSFDTLPRIGKKKKKKIGKAQH